PNCWSRPVIYEGFPSIVSSPSVSSNSLKFRAATDEPTYAVSPAFAEDINNLRVRFYLRREGDNSGTIDVGVMSDPTDISTFELVQTIDQEEEDVFEEYMVYFNTTELTGGNNYIAIRQNSDAQNWYYWVDDFVVELIPTCIEPSELTATDITTTGATLSWISDGSLFDIEVGHMGEDPTGTPTDSGVGNPYTVEGLESATTYDLYVRVGRCTDWSDSFSFTTLSDCESLAVSSFSLSICPGETTDVITITEGVDNYDTYEWSPAEGVSGDETTGWTFTAEETTTFTLTASQSEGACTQTVTVEVVVNPLPVAADLEEEYVVCPETIQAISTGLSIDGANGYDVVWAPFDNLYLDAEATTAYNGESAGTVYFFSADAGDTTYEVTATSSKGCESTFETAVSVPEVITPDIEDVYLCVPTSVDVAVESTLNLVWFDSLDSETPIDEFAATGTYYVMNEVG